jgi:hypothetical protein
MGLCLRHFDGFPWRMLNGSIGRATNWLTFIAVAENAEGRFVAGESRRLPANRLPRPLSIDRRPMQIMQRHERLVDELKRQGWVPVASKGRDWWSDRFRRRLGP